MGRNRQLQGKTRKLVRLLLIIATIMGTLFAAQVLSLFNIAIYAQQYLGLFLAIAMIAVFLSKKPTDKIKTDTVPWYDWVLTGASLIVGGYYAIWFPEASTLVLLITFDKWIVGTLAAILTLEAARRIYGWVLVAIAAIAMAYSVFSGFLPGVFHAGGVSWPRLSTAMLLGTNGILGSPTHILATIVLIYVLFGNVLFDAGGGQVLVNLALSLMGRFRGGGAKVAVFASALFGMMSGSAVSNVAVTGSVTIPLMKQVGYKPHVAGGIEAAAATGGLITPPVMGAVAFMMADYLRIPYARVALAAALPATLYYLCLWLQVDWEAGKTKLVGLRTEQVPKMKVVVREGWFFGIPIFILIWGLFIQNYEPSKAGVIAVLSVLGIILALRLLGKRGSMNFWNMLERTGRSLIDLAIIGALAGIIICSFDLSGLGFTLTLGLQSLAGNSLLALLLLTGASTLLMDIAMGLPGIAIYVIQVALMAPLLISNGVVPLAAHFFILYWGVFSQVTPPVAIAAFAAANIAGSDPMKTGWQATNFCILGYVLPMIFAYHPTLLLVGQPFDIVLDFLTAVIGVFALSIGIRGFFLFEVGWVVRLLLILAGLGMIVPAGSITFGWYLNALALVVIIAFVVSNWMQYRRKVCLTNVETGS